MATVTKPVALDETLQRVANTLEEISEHKTSIINDNLTVKTATWSSEKINKEINDAKTSVEESKMQRVVLYLSQNNNVYSLKDKNNVNISFSTLYDLVKDETNYVVVLMGNSKLRPQYVSTSEIHCDGEDRDSQGTIFLRMVMTPNSLYYNTARLADKDDIPESLPNPNALTFTGAVSGAYDGSEPMTVNIPSGGGGKPWRLINETELTEEARFISFDRDSDGNPFELEEVIVGWYCKSLSSATAEAYGKIVFNSSSIYSFSFNPGSVFRKSGQTASVLAMAKTLGNAIIPVSCFKSDNLDSIGHVGKPEMLINEISGIAFSCTRIRPYQNISSVLVGNDVATSIMAPGSFLRVWGR